MKDCGCNGVWKDNGDMQLICLTCGAVVSELKGYGPHNANPSGQWTFPGLFTDANIAFAKDSGFPWSPLMEVKVTAHFENIGIRGLTIDGQVAVLTRAQATSLRDTLSKALGDTA